MRSITRDGQLPLSIEVKPQAIEGDRRLRLKGWLDGSKYQYDLSFIEKEEVIYTLHHSAENSWDFGLNFVQDYLKDIKAFNKLIGRQKGLGLQAALNRCKEPFLIECYNETYVRFEDVRGKGLIRDRENFHHGTNLCLRLCADESEEFALSLASMFLTIESGELVLTKPHFAAQNVKAYIGKLKTQNFLIYFRNQFCKLPSKS